MELPEIITTGIAALFGGGGAAVFAKWQSGANKEAINRLSKKIEVVDDKADMQALMMASNYVTKVELRENKADIDRRLDTLLAVLNRIEDKLDRKADKNG